MARYPYHGTTKDQNGRIVQSATVSVYLAGTTTAATVYSASSGGSGIGSVTSDSTNGTFTFYVDRNDYAQSQRFKLTISKTGFTSVSYDDIALFTGDSWNDVLDFGAVGNGTTDDTTAVQAALSDLTTGGVVYFPAGTYLISSQLTVNSNTKIVGEGIDNTTIKAGSNGINLFANVDGSGNATYSVNDVYIGYMTLDGDGDGQGSLTDGGNDNYQHGVYFADVGGDAFSASGFTFECLKVKNWYYDGIELYGTQKNTITNVVAEYCGSTNDYAALGLDNALKQTYVNGLHATNCGSGIRTNGSATDTTRTIDDFSIRNVYVDNPVQHGLDFQDGGATRVWIENFTVLSPGANGIRINSANTSGTYPYACPMELTLKNIYVTDPGTVGLRLGARRRITVYNATVIRDSGTPTHAMILQAEYDSDGVQYLPIVDVRDCYLYGTFSSALIELTGSKGRLIGNTFSNNSVGISVVAGSTDNSILHNYFDTVTTTLSDSGTTTHIAGNHGLSDNTHSEVKAASSGAKTLTSGGAVVLTLDMGTVSNGDIIHVQGEVLSTKGATAGDTRLYVDKSSGTASIRVLNSLTVVRGPSQYQVNAVAGYIVVSGYIHVTGDGTLVLGINGVSDGSDSTVGDGDGQASAVFVQKEL